MDNMQDPIFEKFNINSHEFWEEVNRIPDEYKEQHIRVNRDTYYVNHFMYCAQKRICKGFPVKLEIVM